MEWQGLMSQVFTLLEEDDGGVAAAVKTAMDACGICNTTPQCQFVPQIFDAPGSST